MEKVLCTLIVCSTITILGRAAMNNGYSIHHEGVYGLFDFSRQPALVEKK